VRKPPCVRASPSALVVRLMSDFFAHLEILSRDDHAMYGAFREVFQCVDLFLEER